MALFTTTYIRMYLGPNRQLNQSEERSTSVSPFASTVLIYIPAARSLHVALIYTERKSSLSFKKKPLLRKPFSHALRISIVFLSI